CRKLKRVPTFAQACATLRAPSATISLIFSLYQGTFYASTQVITQEGVDGGDAAMGSIAFCLLLAVAPFCVWWCTTPAAGRDCFRYDYTVSTTLPSAFRGVLGVVLLPYSRIEPPDVSQRLAALVSSYRSPHPLNVVISLIVPYCLSLLSLWHPTGSAACRVFFWLVIVVHCAVMLFVAVVSPFRFRFDSALFLINYSVNLAMLMCMIVAMENPRFLSTTVSAWIGCAMLGAQVVGVCFRIWTVIAERLFVVDVTPTEFMWSSVPLPEAPIPEDQEALSSKETSEFIFADETLEVSEHSMMITMVPPHSAEADALVGDTIEFISDLDEVFSRLSFLRDDNYDLL
ncbi:membrane-associated protein, putative, partial [Bodo saltans]